MLVRSRAFVFAYATACLSSVYRPFREGNSDTGCACVLLGNASVCASKGGKKAQFTLISCKGIIYGSVVTIGLSVHYLLGMWHLAGNRVNRDHWRDFYCCKETFRRKK
jgi:hypothetical protein